MFDKTFWSKQRVLLTGHTGFKGAWLSIWLEKVGAQIFGVSLDPDTDPSLFRLLESSGRISSTITDIRDRAALEGAVALADPTVVIHMAAQALVRRGYRTPIETFDTNVMGTANLLETLRDRPSLKAVLVVTTDKVYRNIDDGRAFREDDALGAHDPYSASKAAAEIAVSSWRQSFFRETGVPVVTARAGNVIGGGDWSQDRLVPDIWRAIQARDELVLRYPGAIRPWQHVLEPLAGYLIYVEKIAGAGPHANFPVALNFGPYPDDLLTVTQVAVAMQAALGVATAWREDCGQHPVEMRTLRLDPALAEASIGWHPLLASRDAIEWTAEWYGGLAQGKPARELCLEQIAHYEALL